MKLCRQCHRMFAESDSLCPEHGATLEPDPLIGTRLGNFDVEGWLGEGGMALLYRAKHSDIKLQVAVKVIKREYVEDAGASGRFLQEARLVAQLRHPHLIDIFDIGKLPDGRPYYVMELLSGRSLAARMQAGPLPFAEFAPLYIQACEAIEAAHAHGIVHRDLKPDNLFLSEAPGEPPRLKVLDFGVAKLMNTDEPLEKRFTRTGYIVGTPQYMAPEQVEGGAIDHRVDIYALGVILYELATGRLPFQAETLGAMLKAHLATSPPVFEPSQLAPGVPIALESVAFKALMKSPDERYSSVRELRLEIERLLNEQPTEASQWWVARASSGLSSFDTLPGHLRTTIIRKLPTGERNHPGRAAGTLPKVLLFFGAGVLLTAGGVVLQKYWLSRNKPVAVPAPPPPAPAQTVDPRRQLQEAKSKALAVITAGLRDGDPHVRELALQALAAGKDPHHRSLAEPLLGDAASDVRRNAATCLAALGSRQACQALRDALGRDPSVDIAVADALLQLGDPTGRSELLKRLDDKRGSDKTRIEAALKLLERHDSAAQAYLSGLRKQIPPGDSIAMAILAGFARAGDPQAIEQLAGQLDSADKRTVLMAADALSRGGDDRGLRKLLELGQMPGPDQLRAYRMLAAVDDQSGFDLFQKAIKDPARSPTERALAAQGLGASGETAVLALLIPVLDEPEPEPRLGAAGAILAIVAADPQVLAARSLAWANDALADSDWLVRRQAVAALGEATPDKAVPLLAKALGDVRAEVRQAAAKNLGQLGAREAVAYLAKALDDSEADVRLTALRALGRIQDTQAAQLLSAQLSRAGATAAEKIVAAGQLLQRGDASQTQALGAALRSSDPALRKLAVEEAASAGGGNPALQKEALVAALADRAAPVRLAAALKLAEQGLKDGNHVLEQAMRQGGGSALEAYAALRKLGITPQITLDPATLLGAKDAATRAEIMDQTTTLPAPQAIGLLQRGLGDSDAQVRQAALSALADLASAHPERWESMRPLLKRVLSQGQGDTALQARAGLLLNKLQARVSGSTAPINPTVPTPAAAPTSGQAPLAAPPPVPPPAAGQSPTAPPDPVLGQPDEAQLAMTHGELALQAGKYSRAIADLRHAEKLGLSVSFSLAEAYRKQGDSLAEGSRRRDAYQQAVRYYRRSRDRRAAAYIKELQERLKE